MIAKNPESRIPNPNNPMRHVTASDWRRIKGLGCLSAEATAAGVIRVRLGARGRRQRGAGDRHLARFFREAAAYARGKRRAFTVPFALELQGDFTRRVLLAAARISYGRTTTYAALARAAGSPRAARAAGQAMKRNPLPLIIPCHRVLAAGGFGGFSCGLAWKKRLLMLEKSE